MLLICALGAYWYCSGLSMHHDHRIFVQGINQKKIVKLTSSGEEQASNLVRLCAPMYYNQGQTEGDDLDLYLFWDFKRTKGKYVLSVPPSQILNMELTEDSFSKEDFIHDRKRSGKSTETPDS